MLEIAPIRRWALPRYHASCGIMTMFPTSNEAVIVFYNTNFKSDRLSNHVIHFHLPLWDTAKPTRVQSHVKAKSTLFTYSKSCCCPSDHPLHSELQQRHFTQRVVSLYLAYSFLVNTQIEYQNGQCDISCLWDGGRCIIRRSRGGS